MLILLASIAICSLYHVHFLSPVLCLYGEDQGTALGELYLVVGVMEAKVDILALIIAVDKLIFMLNLSLSDLFIIGVQRCYLSIPFIPL